MTRFQTIFTVILVILGVVGVGVFALSKAGSGEEVPVLVAWGTMPESTMTDFLNSIDTDTKDIFKISYYGKDEATLEQDLVAALARGAGPDMLLMPQDFILKQLDKFYIVPFQNYSERAFKDSFVQEAELYLGNGGIIGIPFSLDPMVMYWNRDIFANAGVALPPTTWTEFFTLAPKITTRDESGNISQSLVAFGETRNVEHAKDMIALLTLQAGNPIVAMDAQGSYVSTMSDYSGGPVPAEQAVSYFTEFSNPNKPSYSWNRSLFTDRNMFTAGKLAVYFGYASEISGLRAANPNLNFDVAAIPQTSAGRKVAFGAMNAWAILKSSQFAGSAFTAAVSLSDYSLQQRWVEYSGLAPIRRDMLSTVPTDAYRAVVYQNALVSSAWLDPNPAATDGVFARMIENVTSGKLRVSEAVRTASLEIGSLLRANNI